MTTEPPKQSRTPRFSLRNLLVLTTAAAIAMAVGTAYRKSRSMAQHRDVLLSMSSQLNVTDESKLTSSRLPKVSDRFDSWNVFVPDGEAHELRLGAGDISHQGVPPVVGAVGIPAGRHRVTLYSGHRPEEAYRYAVYLDGEQVIEKAMGSDWVPGGWGSASGVSWPRNSTDEPAPLQLEARSYRPRHKFGSGSGRYFNGQHDDFVTLQGYRLWIDVADGAYPPTSPMIGVGSDPTYQGIGLRDGLRRQRNAGLSYDWVFTRPSLESSDAVLAISASFFAGEDEVLSSESPGFQTWRQCGDPNGLTDLGWHADPDRTEYTAFLHAQTQPGQLLQPVVELKWDTDRPDELGLRLARAPANDRLTRWRLRFSGGAEHLCRQLSIGDKTVEAGNALDQAATSTKDGWLSLDLASSATADTVLRWQTNETLPLQIVERTKPPYAGLGLYQGLPLTSGVQIPAAMKPSLRVKLLDEHPLAAGTGFPGGAVFEEIEVDLDATGREWIWLRAEPMEQPAPTP